MHMTPDSIIFFSWNGIVLNATILYTWIVMAILITISLLITRNISPDRPPTKLQLVLESIVTVARSEIGNLISRNSAPFLPFIGTLFLFISVSNLLASVPLYHPPTGSLSTTVALALCVFFAAPIYGISQQGVWGYLKTYAQPIPMMIPFNIIGDLSRVLSMSVRLYGNVLSGTLIGGVLITLVPIILPAVYSAFELLIGQIQAYIFSVLASIAIAAAVEVAEERTKETVLKGEEDG